MEDKPGMVNNWFDIWDRARRLGWGVHRDVSKHIGGRKLAHGYNETLRKARKAQRQARKVNR